MFSHENEFVEFDIDCDCSGQVKTQIVCIVMLSVCACVFLSVFSTFFSHGQVEVWLNRVLERMVETLRAEFGEAVQAYEEKAREQWLFDYPAQVPKHYVKLRHYQNFSVEMYTFKLLNVVIFNCFHMKSFLNILLFETREYSIL